MEWTDRGDFLGGWEPPPLRRVHRPVRSVTPDREATEAMVILGVDSHKRTHTVVAVEAAGRKPAEKKVAATSAGHLELVRWVGRFPERRFALEDCRHLSRRLSSDLLCAGEAGIRVHPKPMAGARRSRRQPRQRDP